MAGCSEPACSCGAATGPTAILCTVACTLVSRIRVVGSCRHRTPRPHSRLASHLHQPLSQPCPLSSRLPCCHHIAFPLLLPSCELVTVHVRCVNSLLLFCMLRSSYRPPYTRRPTHQPGQQVVAPQQLASPHAAALAHQAHATPPRKAAASSKFPTSKLTKSERVRG